MALFVDLAGGCEKILRQMSDLTKNNYPFLLGAKTGIIDFLLNPLNGSIKLDLNNAQMGKKYVRTKLVYKKPTLACQILEDDDVPSICDDGAEPEEESVDVTISKHFSTPIRTFSNAKMINICQDTESFIKEYLLSDMKALREKVASYLLTAADAASGVNVRHNGTTVPAGTNTDIQVLGTSSDTGTMVPLYANFIDIGLDYTNNLFNGYPHIVGQGNMQKFFELQKWSCCNASGVAYDAAIAQSNTAFYLDQQANAALGANEVLAFAPNVAHLLWFNENNNINIDTQTEQHIVIPDPVYPQLKWDLDFRWDCAKSWNYKLSAWVDFFAAIQDDAFGDDEASPSPACETAHLGVNGIFKYRATAA
jgi:hypothetical protein